MKEINYIEFWATRHCNLTCRGCSSVSPIARKWCLEEASLSRDLGRFVSLGISIRNVNILGGEPLLHPKIVDLMRCVKRHFPNTKLGILTNGLLLPKMCGNFWEACRELDVRLSVTLFPILQESARAKLLVLLKTNGVDYRITDKHMFNKILTLRRGASMADIRNACGCKGACNLFNGQVSRCTVPMVAPLLNERYGCNFEESGRLNIHTATADEIVRFLSTPNDSCANCTDSPQKIEWSLGVGSPEIGDWIVEGGC